jgi:sugar O-acyltransferase (sialic acid O-acetyltransferase NeuD family)
VTEAIGIVGVGDQARETAGYVVDGGGQVRFHAAEPAWLAEARADARLEAPVLSMADAHSQHPDAPVIVALGYPGDRSRLASAWPGDLFATHVSDRAWLAPGVEVGAGSVVCPGAIVNRLARLGRHVLVNLGATISHDCEIGDFVTISPGANIAGHVTLGDGSFVGIGATISDRVQVGQGCLIGAGAVVVRDVADGQVVAGVPARMTRVLTEWP